MREIKFRGKTYDGEWIVGYHRVDCYEAADEHLIIELGGNDMCEYVVIPETVGQFSGREDDNGIDIYEGDLIEYKYLLDGCTYTAELLFCSYGFNTAAHHPLRLLSEVKVKGNIHDPS